MNCNKACPFNPPYLCLINGMAAGRTQVACEIVSQYLPPDLISNLIASYEWDLCNTLSIGCNVLFSSFTDLDAHIKAVTEEFTVLPPPTTRPAAVQKKDNDEKKRKAASQLSKGVSKLMKVNTPLDRRSILILHQVNTTGMSKISSFFKKPGN